ncbi:SDR family NAD(P)-dependent oxidoreductase [Mesorhizobium sp. ES1-1]|uniref:SDR family NAD(P)-dependent oxidoreductase n=1 Tax=Mesorhizobium sp. ES1-1 TaxID=2876629 RepID=UPI001CC9405C|nr:SDR family oxidoreductase [Mesorhizobium sp. ES1-1]MBZ9676499.1 SDR family oxidoreductase [Mesorhizobium sp. ES1-1]
MTGQRRPEVMLITGAASGIGAAIARLAVQKAYRVAIADIAFDAARKLASELGDNALPIDLDICSPQMWRQALDATRQHFGGLDILVNNAGIAHPGLTADVPLEMHEQTLKVNALGPMLGAMTVIPHFKAQGSGHVVTVCSMTSFLTLPGLVSYAASKHALRAMHFGIALEERASPIDFTIVHPGATETPMLELEAEKNVTAAFARAAASPDAIAAIILKAIKARKVEVCIPSARGRVVKAIGANPRRLFDVVQKNQEIGAKALADRKASL